MIHLIIFENINFSNILEQDRRFLIELSFKNKVIIGKGCIKYRLQSPDKTLHLEQDNQALITEFVQTFTNYFVKQSGMNLGMEVKHRTATFMTFFFFSDDNITQAKFEERLQYSENDFLGLIFLDKAEFENFQLKTAAQQSKLVNKIDGMAALWSIFVRVGIRIATGHWTTADSENLLLAVNFNKNPLLNFNNLHRLLKQRFNQEQITTNYFIKRQDIMQYIDLQNNKGQVNITKTGNIQTNPTFQFHSSSPKETAAPLIRDMSKLKASANFIQSLRDYVKRGEIEELIDALLLFSKNRSTDFYNYILRLSGNYQRLLDKQIEGVISKESIAIEINELVGTLMALVDKIKIEH